MKIGIIGLGSIGQRHIRILRELGYVDIVALRTKKGTFKKLPNDLLYIKEYLNPEEFYSLNLDGIIISNPTFLHIESMKIPLQKSIPLFVEKPMANYIEETKKIKNYDKSKVMVGFCFRYNEIIRTVKSFISSGEIGKIFKANIYCGHFLPFWHKYADYKKEYFSVKSLGGGVLRTLSHEIDITNYFFGKIRELCSSIEKISNLEINVEDNTYIICRMQSNCLVTIELDYLNPIYNRKGIIFGSRGILEYSFSKGISFIDYKGETRKIIDNKNIDNNKMYLEQMKHFINLIMKKEKPVCSYEDGLYVMQIIEAAEKSMKLKTWQTVGV